MTGCLHVSFLNHIGIRIRLHKRGFPLVPGATLGVSHLGVTYLIRAHFFIHRQPLPPPLAAVAGQLRGSLPFDSRGA